MAHAMRWLRSLWRSLLRLERPRQAIVSWRAGGLLAVVSGCLLVALLSSWPWLVEPSLRPGVVAPFTVRAPRAATVVDSTALEQRRSQMVPRTSVQVIDARASEQLMAELEHALTQLRRQRDSAQPRIDPLNLTSDERRWIRSLDPILLASWEQAVRTVQLRMLRQGVVANVADEPLLEAARLHLIDQPPIGRQLGSRLVARSLQGRTNLRTDPLLSQQRIEELVTRNGLPTITALAMDMLEQVQRQRARAVE